MHTGSFPSSISIPGEELEEGLKQAILDYFLILNLEDSQDLLEEKLKHKLEELKNLLMAS